MAMSERERERARVQLLLRWGGLNLLLSVLGVVATIDRQEGARENVERAGLIFDALFTKSDLGVGE